ncbi:MAG: putative DNA binding domain-containing protein [Bacteroidia bacterium]|nr:putative DNA binding domain-containing protein [Bacteroidia bacterium]
MNELEIKELIARGEGYHLEFKEENISNEDLAKILVCFANTDGGRILVGIDNNGNTKGVSDTDKIMLKIDDVAINRCENPISILQETAQIDNKTIVIVNVPKGSQRPYRTKSGNYYVRASNRCRQASREELLRIFQASESLYYDELAVSRSGISDMDINRFKIFLKDALYVTVNNDDEIKNYLKNFHLIAIDNTPTVTGILFFCGAPQKFLPEARIICAFINGNDLSIAPDDKKEITGTIPQMLEDTEKFLKIYLKEKHEIKNFEPEIKFEIPFESMRESVLNAVAHRDYTINSPIRIIIFSDRIEVHSPGKLPNTVTIDSIKVGGSHILRNPTIYNLLVKMRMVTDLGSGVMRIIKLIQEHIKKEVDFKETDSEFILIIPRKNN